MLLKKTKEELEHLKQHAESRNCRLGWSVVVLVLALITNIIIKVF